MKKLSAKVITTDSNNLQSTYTFPNVNPDVIANATGWTNADTAFRNINQLSTNNYQDTELTAVYSVTEEVSD